MAGIRADGDGRIGQFADEQRHDRFLRNKADRQRIKHIVQHIDAEVPVEVFLDQAIR